jgi:hypothetical protein
VRALGGRDGADRFGWGLMKVAEGRLSLMARKWKGTSIPQCLFARPILPFHAYYEAQAPCRNPNTSNRYTPHLLRDPALCPSEDLTRKIGDTFMGHIAMHTFATVLLLTVHLSHTGRSPSSGPNPPPHNHVLSRRLVLQSAPHHPRLRGPSLPFLSSPLPALSQLIPPSSLTTPTSVGPTSVATGRRRAAPPAPPCPPASWPSC